MATDAPDYDFAAHTTIGERVEAPSMKQKKAEGVALGPSFGVPAKLQPFVLLAKSARGGAAAALVGKAVAAPGVYVFSELMEQQSTKDLATKEQHQQAYRLLELFAYGVWGDYVAKRDSYPTLSPEQETKLKQLTILSLATQSRSIPYSTLLSTLSLPDIPALEDLLIASFYADVLTGRLDQKTETLEVLSAHGRDVRPSPPPASASDGGEEMQVDGVAAFAAFATPSAQSVADLTTSLSSFLTRIQTLLHSLDDHMATLHAASVNSAQSQLLHDETVKLVIEEVHKGDKPLGGKAGGGGGGWKEKITDAAKGAASAIVGGGASSGFGGGGASGSGGGNGGGGGGPTTEGMDVDQPGGGRSGGGRSSRSAGGQGQVPKKRTRGGP